MLHTLYLRGLQVKLAIKKVEYAKKTTMGLDSPKNTRQPYFKVYRLF